MLRRVNQLRNRHQRSSHRFVPAGTGIGFESQLEPRALTAPFFYRNPNGTTIIRMLAGASGWIDGSGSVASDSVSAQGNPGGTWTNAMSVGTVVEIGGESDPGSYSGVEEVQIVATHTNGMFGPTESGNITPGNVTIVSQTTGTLPLLIASDPSAVTATVTETFSITVVAPHNGGVIVGIGVNLATPNMVVATTPGGFLTVTDQSNPWFPVATLDLTQTGSVSVTISTTVNAPAINQAANNGVVWNIAYGSILSTNAGLIQTGDDIAALDWSYSAVVS